MCIHVSEVVFCVLRLMCGMKEGRKENTITNLSEMADFGEGCTDTILLSK